MSSTLKLESGAALEASIIDALPYIDGITNDDRHQAEELIKDEVTFCYASALICRPTLSKTLLTLWSLRAL